VRDVPRAGEAAPPYHARYRRIPVVPIWVPVGRAIPRCVVCADLRRLGTWHQYFADVAGQDINISVRRIDDAEARELLRRNPNLRLTRTGEADAEDAAVLRLRKQVRIQISERFLYTVDEPTAAIIIEARTEEPEHT
jgi:hypothetical protein